MLLKLKPLFDGDDGEREFSIEIPPEEMQCYKVAGEFVEPVKVTGKTVCRTSVVTLCYNLSYTMSHLCDRCSAEFTRRYESNFSHILVRREPPADVDYDDDEYVYCGSFGETLDLNELAISDLLLSMPTKVLCREDCLGICPTCGRNLNDGDCGCAESVSIADD